MKQIAVTSLDPNAEYFISVRAIDADGLESEWSLPLRHTTGAALFSDGDAPANSPEPTTLGGLRQIFVKWDRTDNGDIVEYEVHCVKSTAAPALPPTAGDPETLLATTASTMVAATAEPDGTPFQYQPDGVENTPENANIKQNYWFSIIATDADGPSPSPSAWVAGAMDRTAAGDIVAGAVTAELVDAVIAFAGIFKLRGDLITISPPTVAEDGELEGGIIVFDPANPANKIIQLHPYGSYFRGSIEADILTILQDFELQGTGALQSGASMKIANGVSDPDKAAVIVGSVPTVDNLPPVPTGYTSRGMCHDESTGLILRVLERISTKTAFLEKINMTTGTSSVIALGHPPIGDLSTPDGIYLQPGGSWTGVGGITSFGGYVYFTVGYYYGVYMSPKWYYYTDNVLVRANLSNGTYVNAVVIYSETGNMSPVGVGLGYTAGATKHVVGYHPRSRNVFFEKADLPMDSPAAPSIPLTNLSTTQAVRNVGVGTFDFGGTDPFLVIQTVAGSYVYRKVVGGTALQFQTTPDTQLSWTGAAYPYSPVNGGIFWHHSKGRFVVNTGDTSLRQFSNYYPPTGDAENWAVKYVNTGVSGKTTRQSPISNVVSLPKRAYLSVTLPAAPQGVTGASVWAGQESTGTPTTFYKHSTDFSARTGVLWNGRDRTGTTIFPPMNNFGGSPGKIFSDIGGFVVNGDGTGDWPYIMPTGSIMMFGGTAEPAGFKLCNGQEVSRTEFAALFNVIGTAFGAGNGTDTFNLPNFTDRFPRQSTPGTRGGANTKTLSLANLPSHSHGLTASYNLNAVASGTGTTRISGWVFGTSADTQRTGSTEAAGSGTAFDNQPAYLGVNFIIKI